MNKYSQVFNENMSSVEAGYEFWRMIDLIPKEDRELLLEEFLRVSKSITRRETAENLM